MNHRKDILITVILVLMAVLILPRIMEKSMHKMEKIETINRSAYEKAQAVEDEINKTAQALSYEKQ